MSVSLAFAPAPCRPAAPLPSWARLRIVITFVWRHGYLPNVAQPQGYNEWVQWRKLYDRDVSLAMLTDKLHAKDFAAGRIGAALVIPTLWEGIELPRATPWPMPFVVKANHGCNQFVVVRNERDWARARRQAPRWLAGAYGQWLDEWHYRHARRMLLVEPFIGADGKLPLDYKVFVFRGQARFVQVHLDRERDHRWIQFTCDWQPLLPSAEAAGIPPPSRLADMLRAAERIAGNRDHLRVDFYEVGGRLWFGETCLFPGSGLARFEPVALDHTFGAFWAHAHGR